MMSHLSFWGFCPQIIACRAAFFPCTHGTRAALYGGRSAHAWRKRGTSTFRIALSDVSLSRIHVNKTDQNNELR